MRRPAVLLVLLFASCLAATSVLAADGAKTYGTSTVSYLRVPAVAFLPFDSDLAYSGTFGARWGTTGPSVFYAPLSLPQGARIVSLDLDFTDTNATQALTGNLTVCDRFGTNCTFHPAQAAGPADCNFAGFICSGDAFAGGAGTETADLTPDDLTVDNVGNSYFLRFDTIPTDGSVRGAGILVGYLLQVSPAPGVATFGDVPTNHPFFQYVEALAASGITAGCGSGNFCPDNPLTRGQMAVFLSIALGLQWP
jgi:hypothetical protein